MDLGARHRPHDRGGVVFREPVRERPLRGEPRYELAHIAIAVGLGFAPEGRNVGVDRRGAADDVVDRSGSLNDRADICGERRQLSFLVRLAPTPEPAAMASTVLAG